MSDLPQQDTINQYTADGVEVNYSYTYLVPTDEDIDVFVTPVGQQANDQADIKLLNIDYSVQNAGNVNGGTITFFVAPDGIVTLSRAVEASINTNYVDPKTIIGENLDDSFEREMLVAQQNQSKFDNRSLRYQISSFLPDSDNKNVVPTLDQGYIWIGAAAGGVAAVELNEDPDCSTLRSELANENQNTDGAALVGYFDESRLLPTTVRDQLNDYGDASMGSDGASLIGYYDESTSTETNVAAVLAQLENSLFSPGTYRRKSVPIVDDGWAYCDGSSFDMVGASTNTEIQRLGNAYKSSGMVDSYGYGIDSYTVRYTPTAEVSFTCAEKGVALAPDPHASGFNIIVNSVGNPSVQQSLTVFTTAGNTIVPGTYFEIFAPSGRSSVFWFKVDGIGTEPLFPGSLIQVVEILSTDTDDQVAQKLNAQGFLQYRVPDLRGLYLRDQDNGAGVDPDSALRTDIEGNVIGDIVGSKQEDAVQEHTHTQNSSKGGASASTTAAIPFGSTETSGVNGANVSSETRGKNIYVYTLVKF